MFSAEARSLRRLRDTGALRVPEVVALSDELGHLERGARWLLLEWLEPGRRRADFDELLGRGLAQLHGCLASTWGDTEPGNLATLELDNRPCATWPDFYFERRLLPLGQRAKALGHLGPESFRRLEHLGGRLGALLEPAGPPSHLHGDLWGGNVLVSPEGHPVLIDPSCFGGCREVDLAMMRLFGGFSERVFSAYRELAPLAPGAAERVQLYQLLPLLVHLVLFGAGYRAPVEAILRRFG